MSPVTGYQRAMEMWISCERSTAAAYLAGGFRWTGWVCWKHLSIKKGAAHSLGEETALASRRRKVKSRDSAIHRPTWGIRAGLAGRATVKQSLQGAATSCFLSGFTDKLLLLALPGMYVGICKGGSCPRIPLYVRKWQCFYRLRTVCSPPSLMRVAYRHVHCYTRVQIPSTSRSQCSSAL